MKTYSNRPIETTDYLTVHDSDGNDYKMKWSDVETFVSTNLTTIAVDETLVMTLGTTAGTDYFRINGATKCINRPLADDTFALEVKADFTGATGQLQGAFQCSSRAYPATDTTAAIVRGGYFQSQLHSADAMTGGGLIGLYCQIDNAGTMDGTSVSAALHTDITDDGVYTAVTSLTSLRVESHLSQAVSSGIYSMMEIVNSGTTAADSAIYIDGSDKITSLFSLVDVGGGMVTAATGAVGNTTDKVAVIVDGTTRYLVLYDAIAAT